MKFGYFCVASGVASLIAAAWMLSNGTVFIHGFIAFISLSLFGIYLIRRNRMINNMKDWAKNNPEEAIKWLKSNEGEVK